jgi:hypothetical protein
MNTTTPQLEGIEISPPRLQTDGRYLVGFVSPYESMHHQLYVNGRLDQWTDLPVQRQFVAVLPPAPVRLAVAAVAELSRRDDSSGDLPGLMPPWVYRLRVAQTPAMAPDDQVELLDDHASGVLSPVPLDVAPAWPEYQVRWAFGQDIFGAGAFGFDGCEAAGMGCGAFGEGMFAFDSPLLELEALLEEEGTHRLVIRIRSADGKTRDLASEIVEVPALPP